MVTPEAVPFVKTGGLGDVAGALPRALARLGHRVTVVLPRYRTASGSSGPIDEFPQRLGGFERRVRIFEESLVPGVSALLVDCPDLYDRSGVYAEGMTDYPDNPLRFGFLCMTALTSAARRSQRPSIFHAHDWPTGLLPLYLRTHYANHPVLAGVASVFTIHNIAYQGIFPAEWLPGLDLGWELMHPEGMEFWGHISLLKAGLNFSDLITTVSRRHAKEIVTPEYGFGFEGILQRRKDRLVGVLNGIDQDVWNPETDPYLPEPYSASDLRGKATAKRVLLETMGLPTDEAALARPIIGMVSRLVDQKGFDLLERAAGDLLRFDVSYVLLGSGAPEHESFWRDLASKYPGRVAVRTGFDEPLAHLIEGGADLFLMPSRYEPCGLNQMYSQRYGTVPVVRATGGLYDTVRNYNERTGEGTGFRFDEYDPVALVKAVARALKTFTRKDDWHALQLAGMAQDFSWDVSAVEYVKVYKRAIKDAAQRTAAVAIA